MPRKLPDSSVKSSLDHDSLWRIWRSQRGNKLCPNILRLVSTKQIWGASRRSIVIAWSGGDVAILAQFPALLFLRYVDDFATQVLSENENLSRYNIPYLRHSIAISAKSKSMEYGLLH